MLAGRVPVAIKRATEPVPVDEFYPEYTTDDYTAVHKSTRKSERKTAYHHENNAKMIECESVIRSLNDRIYSTIYLRVRDTAPIEPGKTRPARALQRAETEYTLGTLDDESTSELAKSFRFG